MTEKRRKIRIPLRYREKDNIWLGEYSKGAAIHKDQRRPKKAFLLRAYLKNRKVKWLRNQAMTINAWV